MSTKVGRALGFRSFFNFNKVLLGKQAWHLFAHPQLLVSKVLKACYFPQGDFLTSLLGNSPSLTWRSILWGHDQL